jgi:integrase
VAPQGADQPITTELFEGKALANLSPQARREYAALWRTHVHPRLQSPGLAQTPAQVVEEVRAELHEAGVDRRSIEATLTLVREMTDGYTAPVAEPGAAQPRRGGSGPPPPVLEPLAVERIRARLGRRGATLVSVLAYAGLRPSEALELRWSDVEGDSIRVPDAPPDPARDGGARRAPRPVRLLLPVAEDLVEWRKVVSHRGRADLVFPHRTRGRWTDFDWTLWRHRRFATAVKHAGLPPELAPLDLRHTLAQLLIGAGVPLVDVAREMGAAPLVAWSMYRPLFEQAERGRARSASAAIISARKSGAAGQAA